MKNHLLSILLVCFTIPLFGQSTLTAKVIDAKNNPIPFATIQTAPYKGVISNEEGFFTIHMEDVSEGTVTISCLGFEEKVIAVSDIKANDYVITLKDFINELDAVYLSNAIPDANSIIKKANERLTENYANEGQMYHLFFRNTSYIDFNRLEFKINKASGMKKKQLVEANNSMDSLMQVIMNSKAIHFKDYMADLFVQDRSHTKLKVYQATQLLDKNQNVSIDQVQKKAQHLILKYLDTTKTYKLKTGLFKIEDSLALNESRYKNKNKKPNHTYETSGLKSESHELLHTSQIYDNARLRSILNTDYYKYEFVDTTVYNGELVYIITFFPRKAKAKYTGTLYITDETYAIIKLNYAFGKGKRGEKFNMRLLLGVKYVENINSGTIIFSKNDQGKYQPQYIKEEVGNFFYVNRPLKFIENSPSKHKVSFNFLVEGGTRDKREAYFISNSALDQTLFNAYAEPKTVPFVKLKQYDPGIWKAYNAIEPLEEMKRFKSIED